MKVEYTESVSRLEPANHSVCISKKSNKVKQLSRILVAFVLFIFAYVLVVPSVLGYDHFREYAKSQFIKVNVESEVKMKVEYEYGKKVIDFSCLKQGDAFVFNAGRFTTHVDDCPVFIKCQESRLQLAVNLRTGDFRSDCCGKLVIPVMANVKWNYESD